MKSWRQQQWHQARHCEQNAAFLKAQIHLENSQLYWQEKPAMKNTQVKPIQQLGFVTNLMLSIYHNASNVLTMTPTWYYFSHPPT